MCAHVRTEIGACPVLVETVSTDMPGWSLPKALYEKTHCELAHPTVRSLIAANLSTFLWGRSNTRKQESCICALARNGAHCVLMPWVAAEFPLVFDNPVYPERPPHCQLFGVYIDKRCGALTVRQFYKHTSEASARRTRW